MPDTGHRGGGGRELAEPNVSTTSGAKAPLKDKYDTGTPSIAMDPELELDATASLARPMAIEIQSSQGSDIFQLPPP